MSDDSETQGKNPEKLSTTDSPILLCFLLLFVFAIVNKKSAVRTEPQVGRGVGPDSRGPHPGEGGPAPKQGGSSEAPNLLEYSGTRLSGSASSDCRCTTQVRAKECACAYELEYDTDRGQFQASDVSCRDTSFRRRHERDRLGDSLHTNRRAKVGLFQAQLSLNPLIFQLAALWPMRMLLRARNHVLHELNFEGGTTRPDVLPWSWKHLPPNPFLPDAKCFAFARHIIHS